MLDENHTPLFHPSLPGDLIDEVLITDLESEGVISGVLDRCACSYEKMGYHKEIFCGFEEFTQESKFLKILRNNIIIRTLFS